MNIDNIDIERLAARIERALDNGRGARLSADELAWLHAMAVEGGRSEIVTYDRHMRLPSGTMQLAKRLALRIEDMIDDGRGIRIDANELALLWSIDAFDELFDAAAFERPEAANVAPSVAVAPPRAPALLQLVR